MTNKEAIEILKNKMDGSVDTSYSWCEAIRLAIQALEKTDYLNCEIPSRKEKETIEGTIEKTRGEWLDETLPVSRNKEREYPCDNSRRNKA